MSTTDTTTNTSSSSDTPLGDGSIAVIVMIGFSFIICLLSRGTTAPLLVSFLGALLPVLTFVILYLYPKENSSSDTTQDNRVCCDNFYRIRVVFLVIVVVGAFIGILWSFKVNVFTSHYARKAPSAFSLRNQEEYNRQKEMLQQVKDQGDEDQQGLMHHQYQQDHNESMHAGATFPDITRAHKRFGNQQQKIA